jgi:hypothetical protein
MKINWKALGKWVAKTLALAAAGKATDKLSRQRMTPTGPAFGS